MQSKETFADLETTIFQQNGVAAVLFTVPGNRLSDATATVAESLATEFKSVSFVLVDIGKLSRYRAALGVNAVPLLWICEKGFLKKAVEGANPPEYYAALKQVIDGSDTNERVDLRPKFASAKQAMEDEARSLVEKNAVLVVGKITDANFVEARNIIRGLTDVNGFHSVDLLEETPYEEYFTKVANDCGGCSPSMVFVKGEAIPARQFCEQAEKDETFKTHLAKSLDEGRKEMHCRLEKLIKADSVMLFMKGTKSSPFCRFSRAMIQILNDGGIEFSTFNIFEDSRVREGLKAYSEWPTFPQLYVNGELVGGVDVVKDIIENCGGIENLKAELLR